MSIISSKLEIIFAVKFFEKGVISGYLIIIAKVFEYVFELRYINIKLMVFYNRYNR